MTEQEAQVLRDTATSAEQNALLNSQKLVKMQENYELVCEILEQMIVGAVNTLDLAREVDMLVQERDALRVDAERYRWLREQDDRSPLFCMYGSNGPWGECGHSDIYGELLDKSIDEEMKGKA